MDIHRVYMPYSQINIHSNLQQQSIMNNSKHTIEKKKTITNKQNIVQTARIIYQLIKV